jgi:hypothetical protein
VRAYIAGEFRAFLETPAFLDALPGYLLPDPASQERLPILKSRAESRKSPRFKVRALHNFPIGSSSACPLVTLACLCILLHLPSNCSLPTIPELSGSADSNRAPKGPLPWNARFPAKWITS